MSASPFLEVGAVRVDRWLCAARLFKTRGLAQEACRGGRVKLNGVSVKPSAMLKAGDEIVAEAPRGRVVLNVLLLSEKRLSPSLARTMYEDHSPPPPPKEESFPRRDRGAGRPNKHERRALQKLRGDFS